MAAAGAVDEPARKLVRSVLSANDVSSVTETGAGDTDGTTVVLGDISEPEVAGALRAVGAEVPKSLRPEGFALGVGKRDGAPTVVLAGADGAGQYYAAEKFRELAHGGLVANASVVEQPELAKRGVIEGFYGPPWTKADHLDQLAFYGDMRLNTYIYSPKDDPKLRARWRQPYTSAEIAQLTALVHAAKSHHVTFTYALSPGLSICYNSAADIAALRRKLGQLYGIGVRDFTIPFDDIEYTWAANCGDQRKYGSPTESNTAKAHADLLNTVQREFIATHPGTRPLETVPTDYSGRGSSAYTEALKANLDPKIQVMWTGKFVVPASISTGDARAGERMYGRRPYVWDNYPVNDFDPARLMLGPYTHRAADLHTAVTGIVLNPMPEAAPSKVALATFADYAWDAEHYRPYASRNKIASYLSGGDAASRRALLAFFDTENLPVRPKSYDDPALEPQAPVLARRIAAFEKAWKAGDKQGAVRAFRPYATLLATAERTLAGGKADPRFVADSKEWLDALTLWGRALGRTLDGLAARASGNISGARGAFADSAKLATRAAGVTTKRVNAGNPPERVVVADGVLDTFLRRAPGL